MALLLGWLLAHGVRAPRLTRLPGYTNHVFRVEQAGSPALSVVRVADTTLADGLCPLATDTERVLGLHQDAVALGLAPALLGEDSEVGIQWLAYAGERRAVTAADAPDVLPLLERLHGSALNWRVAGQSADVASLGHLRRVAAQSGSLPDNMPAVAERLLVLAGQRAYADLPLVPVHSDLNPGNWLHDGRRWWLVDWDYAGMRVAGWDAASLIVEHGWPQAEAKVWAGGLSGADLAWFCASFAILSWGWHVARGTGAVAEKAAMAKYWVGRVEAGNRGG